MQMEKLAFVFFKKPTMVVFRKKGQAEPKIKLNFTANSL